MPPARPKIRPVRSPFEMYMELAAAAGLLLSGAVLVYYWPALPERVPSHFGPSGRPDAWSGKNSVLVLAAVSAALFLVLTVLARFPWVYNYPFAITAANAERQYGLARTLVTTLKALLVWTLAVIEWQSLRVATGEAGALGVWPLVLLAGTGAAVLVYLVLAFQSR